MVETAIVPKPPRIICGSRPMKQAIVICLSDLIGASCYQKPQDTEIWRFMAGKISMPSIIASKVGRGCRA
jgi:hypothetical protein